jgi:hypothetical protein
MKAYEEMDLYTHSFLTSAIAGGEWSASSLGRFVAREKKTGTHWRGCWVDLRAGLDDVENRKFLILNSKVKGKIVPVLN